MRYQPKTKFTDRFVKWFGVGLVGYRYWPGAVVIYRVAITLAALIWAASFVHELPRWFGPYGILTRGTASLLLEYEEIPRWQSWSPLWWTDALTAYYGWLAIMGVCLALTLLGIGGRWSVLAALLMLIGWAHRATWITGPVEPALVAFLGFLLIDPGPPLLPTARTAAAVDRTALRRDLTIRAARIHWWILVAAGLLSQLAGLVWWRGEGVWWLAAAGHSWLLRMPGLFDHPLLINALTHGMISVQLLALWWLATNRWRVAGILAGILSCAAIGLVADQTLYGLLLLAGLTSYGNGPVAVRGQNQSQPTKESV
ncbi:MAG: hypothetical protein KatS3mg111_3946 [Pirellulaceae bacterium]|nr:MAG: hypothetical protein KatS3mg111_3946 [Pirellulaceae bacterium]